MDNIKYKDMKFLLESKFYYISIDFTTKIHQKGKKY